VAVAEHGTGVAGGEAARLSAEIEENGIRLPPAEGADGRFVDAGDEKGGGAARAQAVSLDAGRGDVGEVMDEAGSPT